MLSVVKLSIGVLKHEHHIMMHSIRYVVGDISFLHNVNRSAGPLHAFESTGRVATYHSSARIAQQLRRFMHHANCSNVATICQSATVHYKYSHSKQISSLAAIFRPKRWPCRLLTCAAAINGSYAWSGTASLSPAQAQQRSWKLEETTP
jgi:hypothetical protein